MSNGMKMRVGYWWSDKKSQKLNKDQLERHFNERNAELVKVSLDDDLEQQGPFDGIIHKVSDLMCKVDRDEDAREKVEKFEAFVKRHPEMVVVDSLDNVRKVLDRYRQYKIIEDSELADGDIVFTPNFVEMTSTDVAENLDKLASAKVTFPFVCKPIVAHGTKFAHKMSLIFNVNGLRSINPPCVAQSFVNHNAKLFKLFIVKDQYFVIERPSLKNFTSDFPEDVVHFDSHDISKPNSSNFLTELDEEDRKQCEIVTPEKSRLDQIVKVISKELGLFLLGIDVIIENDTGRYAIIDMNSFPGYDGVDNFLELYCNIVIEEIKRSREKFSKNSSSSSSSTTTTTQSASSTTTTTTTTTSSKDESSSASMKSPQTKSTKQFTYSESGIDSGIDTSDSCDEKKHHVGETGLAKLYRKQHSRSTNPNSDSSQV